MGQNPPVRDNPGEGELSGGSLSGQPPQRAGGGAPWLRAAAGPGGSPWRPGGPRAGGRRR